MPTPCHSDKCIRDMCIPMICVSLHTYSNDACIPCGDTQNTDAHLGIQQTKWQLGQKQS